MIWVSPHRDVPAAREDPKELPACCSTEERERVVRVAAAVRSLAAVGAMISPK